MSPLYPITASRLLIGVLPFCTFAGTTDTIFSVLRNGVVIASGLVLPAGVNVSPIITVTPTSYAEASDYMNINVTTAGTGVVDFAVSRVWS